MTTVWNWGAPPRSGAEAVGERGGAAVGDDGAGDAVEDVVVGDGRRLGVRAGVEGGVAALGLGDGVALGGGAAEGVEGDLAGDDHDVGGGGGAGGEHGGVLLGLDDALEAVGEQEGVEGAGGLEGAAGVLVDVAGQRPGDLGEWDGLAGGVARRGLDGGVGEGERGGGLALFVGADDSIDAAEGVVESRGLVGVGVGDGDDLAEAIVVAGLGGEAEAVGDLGDVGGDDRVVFVGQGVTLTGLVGRAGDGLQVAVREVREVGDRGRAVGEDLAHLGDVAGGAVEGGLAPAQGRAAAGHVDARGLDEVVGAGRVGDGGDHIVGGAHVAGVGEAGDVAERVVLVGGIRALARAGAALVEAPVGARQRREDGGGGAGGVGGLGAGVDVAQHVAVLGLGERTAVLVLHDLALQEPLGVEPVGEVVAHDRAVEGSPAARVSWWFSVTVA